MIARTVSAIVVASAVVTLGAQVQTPPFSTKVEMVRVDVLVTDGGRPVQGLTAADFDVVDEGVPQQVELVSFEQIPLNAVLVLDMSNSVAGERLSSLQDAVRAVLSQLKPDDQAALVTFSHQLRLESDLTHDISELREALASAEAFGETAVVDGAYAGIMIAESDVGRSLLLVFSDGVDTSSWLTPEAVLETAKRSDAVVYGVAMRDGGTPRFLRDLSAFTGGSLFQIDSNRDMSPLFLRILEEFRHRYLVSYSPRGVSKTGWHRLSVKIKGRKVNVKARPGYLAGS